MEAIILHDNEDNELIAYIHTQWDIERIKKEYKKLNEEYYEDTYEGMDFYYELSERTGLQIFEPQHLYL